MYQLLDTQNFNELDSLVSSLDVYNPAYRQSMQTIIALVKYSRGIVTKEFMRQKMESIRDSTPKLPFVDPMEFLFHIMNISNVSELDPSFFEKTDIYSQMLHAYVRIKNSEMDLGCTILRNILLAGESCPMLTLFNAWIECYKMNYTASIGLIKTYLTTDPTHPFALSIAIFVSIKLNKYLDAETFAYKYMTLLQHHVHAWLYFLSSLAYLKKWKRLILFSKKASLLLNQQSPEIVLLTAIALNNVGKRELSQKLADLIQASHLKSKIHLLKSQMDTTSTTQIVDVEDIFPEIPTPSLFALTVEDISIEIDQSENTFRDVISENDKLVHKDYQIHIYTEYNDIDMDSGEIDTVLFEKERQGPIDKLLSLYPFSSVKLFNLKYGRRNARSISKDALKSYMSNVMEGTELGHNQGPSQTSYIGRQWHKELYNLINLPVYSKSEYEMKVKWMRKWQGEFMETALRKGTKLILEKEDPQVKEDACDEGIVYKFIDSPHPEELLEVQILNAIFKHFTMIYGVLLTPPILVLHYLGSTILATPIIDEGLLYDFNVSSRVNAAFYSMLCSHLNIRNFGLQAILDSLESNPKEKEVYIYNAKELLSIESSDIPYALGYKGRKRYLRPELVSSWQRQLNTDIDSTVPSTLDDQLLVTAKQDISECSNWLIKEWIPSWSKRLQFGDTISPLFEDFLHDSGINVRHLGVLYNNCSGESLKRSVMGQCVGRVIKNIVRDRLHLGLQTIRENEKETVGKEIIVDVLNRIFIKKEEKIWGEEIVPLLLLKFPSLLSSISNFEKRYQEYILSNVSLFVLSSQMLGIKWTHTLMNDVLTDHTFFHRGEFKALDIEEIAPKVKFTKNIDGEEGWKLEINVKQIALSDYKPLEAFELVNLVKGFYGHSREEYFDYIFKIKKDMYRRGYIAEQETITIEKSICFNINNLILILSSGTRFLHLLQIERMEELLYITCVIDNYFSSLGYQYALILLSIAYLHLTIRFTAFEGRGSKTFDKIPSLELNLIKKAWEAMEQYHTGSLRLQRFFNLFDKYVQRVTLISHVPSITIQIINEFGSDSIIVANFYLSLCFIHCDKDIFSESISNYIMWPKAALKIIQVNGKLSILESQSWWLLGMLESNKDIKVSHYKKSLKLLTYSVNEEFTIEDIPFLKSMYKDWKSYTTPFTLLDSNTRWTDLIQRLNRDEEETKRMLKSLQLCNQVIESLYMNLDEDINFLKSLEAVHEESHEIGETKENPRILNTFGYLGHRHCIGLPGLNFHSLWLPQFEPLTTSWPLPFVRSMASIQKGFFHGNATILYSHMLRQISSISVVSAEFSMGLPTGSNNKILYYNNAEYTGELEKGYRHGKGLMVNQEYRFEGNYRKDKTHGKGTLKEKNEETQGLWDCGKLVLSKRDLVGNTIKELMGGVEIWGTRKSLINKRAKSAVIQREDFLHESESESFSVDISELMKYPESTIAQLDAVLCLRDSNLKPEYCKATLHRDCVLRVQTEKTSYCVNLQETIVADLLGDEKEDVLERLESYFQKEFSNDAHSCILYANFNGSNIILTIKLSDGRPWLKYCIASMGGEKQLHNFYVTSNVKRYLKKVRQIGTIDFLSICKSLFEFSLGCKDQTSYWRDLIGDILGIPGDNNALWKQLVIAAVVMYGKDNHEAFRLALDMYSKVTDPQSSESPLSPDSLLIKTTLFEHIIDHFRISTFGYVIGKCLEIIWNLRHVDMFESSWYTKENIRYLNKVSTFASTTPIHKFICLDFIVSISLALDIPEFITFLETSFWKKCKLFYTDFQEDPVVGPLALSILEKIMFSDDSVHGKLMVIEPKLNELKLASRNLHNTLQQLQKRSGTYEEYVAKYVPTRM